ncbi:MAG: AEC family transporter [Pseudoruegeria sp.]
MVEIFLKTLPFFGVIALGYGAGRTQFFSEDATAYLTKFVFFFPLSAMLFKFAAHLDIGDVWDWNYIFAYLLGTSVIYIVATTIALIRQRGVAEAAVEAQCAVIGNVGFLGIPMLALLLGPAAVPYVMMLLAVDLIVFSSVIVILLSGSRQGGLHLGLLKTAGAGLLRNPMVVSMALGLSWSAFALPIPDPVDAFLDLLSGAATPGALFAVGASLASKSAERLSIAGYLSFFKLVVHPAAIAFCALVLFPVPPFAAGVMIAAAALPVAGNVFMLAQHYGVAPQRASASILISTVLSILTLPLVIGWVTSF